MSLRRRFGGSRFVRAVDSTASNGCGGRRRGAASAVRIAALSSSAVLAISSGMVLVVPAARAGDGVHEIHQTCAVQSGCFSGDAPGFPVTIGSAVGRAFRLTSDLVVSGLSADAIAISASDVDLDLAGFSIRGPVVCSGSPIVCSGPTGTAAGVSGSGTFSGVSLHGGSIVGMSVGASLGNRAVVRDLRVRSNRLEGIKALGDARVESVLAFQNGGTGISISSGLVVGSAVQGNGKVGIFFSGTLAGSNATATRNVVRANEDVGILGSGALHAIGNASTANSDDGIAGGAGSRIESNLASSNLGDGIRVASESTVVDNLVRANVGVGLRATANRLAYRGNTLDANVAGAVSAVAPFANQGANACNGTASCP